MRLIFGLTIFILGFVLFPGESEQKTRPAKALDQSKIETFSFQSNGENLRGKVYLPPSYQKNKNLPAIYLIDFTDQHFKLATDEFEKVIEAVAQINGFEALVVSLEEIADIDAEPEGFDEHYAIYKNLTRYVDNNYTENASRTLIARGSESGIVLMSMFLKEDESTTFENFVGTDPSGLYGSAIIELLKKDDFPKNKQAKKLHFSFSTSNDKKKCTEIINLIDKADYQWLSFQSKEYTQSDYENTYPTAYAEGLKFVFEE